MAGISSSRSLCLVSHQCAVDFGFRHLIYSNGGVASSTGRKSGRIPFSATPPPSEGRISRPERVLGAARLADRGLPVSAQSTFIHGRTLNDCIEQRDGRASSDFFMRLYGLGGKSPDAIA